VAADRWYFWNAETGSLKLHWGIKAMQESRNCMQFKRLTLVLSALVCRSFCWLKAKHTRTSLRVLDARSGTRALRKQCCTPSVELWLMCMAASISTTRPLSIRTMVECWLHRPASHIPGTLTKFRMRSSHLCLLADIQRKKQGNYVCLRLEQSFFRGELFLLFPIHFWQHIVLCRWCIV